jgi:hypothetical protein
MSLKSNPSCKRYRGYYPNTTPVITGLSDYYFTAGVYHVVYIYGNNFYPNDVTKLDIIGPNKTYENYPFIYFTNKCISFSIPADAFQGFYDLQIKNVDYRIIIPDYLYSGRVPYELT